MENTDKNSMEKIVRSLVEQYGKDLYLAENELRFKGLLFDFASDFARELKTLKIALAERIPAKLLTCDDKDDEEKSRTLQNCKDTLVDEVGLMEERVTQVLNVLAEGLGWNVKLDVKTETSKEESLANINPTIKKAKKRDNINYEELVYKTIGSFPYKRTRYTNPSTHIEGAANAVNIGSADDIDAMKFTKILRNKINKYRLICVQNLTVNDDIEYLIDKSLKKLSSMTGALYLVVGKVKESKYIGGYIELELEDENAFCAIILVKDSKTHVCIDGFQCYGKVFHYDEIFQNTLQFQGK